MFMYRSQLCESDPRKKFRPMQIELDIRIDNIYILNYIIYPYLLLLLLLLLLLSPPLLLLLLLLIYSEVKIEKQTYFLSPMCFFYFYLLCFIVTGRNDLVFS